MTGGPLEPLRVLDLSSGLPGSVMTLMLAAYGAEVIKVERPDGEPTRVTGANRMWDRGKRSVVLDLHVEADRAVVAGLAREADVVVDGFRTGRLDALGLGYDHLAVSNPRLVYCSLSGYGEWSRWRDRPGVDALVAARLGLMADQPGYREEGPIFLGHAAVGYGTALLGLTALLAGVRTAYLSGRGQKVDVSMLDGALAQTTMHWASDGGFASFQRANRGANAGRPDFGRRRLILDTFECADGRVIHVHTGAMGAFQRAMRAFGLDDRISPADGPVEMASEMTAEEVEILRTELPRIIRSKPADEWLELLWKSEVAALPLQPPGESFDDPQVRHNGLIESIEDPELGPIDVVGPPIRMSATPGRRLHPAPSLDQDGERIRRDGWQGPRAPVSSEQIEVETPLKGLRIIEFSTFFAASFAGRLLADLGAAVIKVEPVNGDPMRPLMDMFEGSQGGKRALAIDMKTDAGREVARELLRAADVVNHNLRPGAAERLGIDYARVRDDNPSVIYSYSPGFGSDGPKARLQSFAPLQSGFAGLFHEAAGVGNRPLSQFGNEDYYNGMLAACGIMLALIHRDRTGEGQFSESPQVHSTVFATAHVYRSNGRSVSTIPTLDADQTGPCPLVRLYRCSDGWLCLACTSRRHVRALLTTLGLTDRVDDPRFGDARAVLEHGDELAALLAERLAERPADDWQRELDAAGVPCEVAREASRRSELLMDPELLEQGFTVARDHPVVGRVYTAGLMFHLSRTPGVMGQRAPLLGEHTREVLLELGYDNATVDAWLESGLARAVLAAGDAGALTVGGAGQP